MIFEDRDMEQDRLGPFRSRLGPSLSFTPQETREIAEGRSRHRLRSRSRDGARV